MLSQSLASAPVRPQWGQPAPGDAVDSPLLSRHPELMVTEFTYGRDQCIFGEGETTEYVYQLMHGAVRSYRLLNDGRRQIGAFHLVGDVFGLESGSSHRLTAEAICETKVRMVKRRCLEATAKSDVVVAYKLWTMTANQLRHAEDHMLSLGRKTAAQRVATFLLEMDRRISVSGQVALPMLRCDIADYLGLTLETVSRTVSQFHDEGALTLSGPRHIRLRDRARLAAMAD